MHTMTVEEALAPIHPVMGLTSVIDAPNSIGRSMARTPTAAEARAEMDRVETAQAECRSDAAYWGYEGQLAYLRAVVNITEAAEQYGALPCVAAPDMSSGAVMDLCSRIEKYGAAVRAAAEATSASPGARAPHPTSVPEGRSVAAERLIETTIGLWPDDDPPGQRPPRLAAAVVKALHDEGYAITREALCARSGGCHG